MSTKAKLLYVLEIMKETDEQCPLTILEIIGKLRLYGIEAERKSVSRDLQTLNDSGYCILSAGRHDGYYLAEREFEDYELMVIAGAISAARFITKRDSENIVKKLKRQAPPSFVKILNETLYIDGEIKTNNATAKYTIDKIIEAIKTGKKLTFKYFEYNADGRKQLRRCGHIYSVSPYYLVWSNEEYFLLANPDSHSNITHFKTAMMADASVSDDPRKKRDEIIELRGNFDLCGYIRANINMYTGKIENIALLCRNSLRTEILGKFGHATRLKNAGNDCFEAHIRATDNDGLYQWLMQYGGRLRVLSPVHVREKVKSLLSEALMEYDGTT